MEWKDVLGYENLYKVNENGDVVRLKNNHILKPFKVMDHYAVNLCKDGKRTTYLMHRLVYEAFNGKIPSGYIVCHITSDLSNNSISNIKLYNSVKERYSDKEASPVKTSHYSNRERVKAVDLDGELWVNVIDSCGKYMISNLGRIKNKKGYIVKPYLKRNTYLCVCLRILKGIRTNVFVHRLVYESFNGRINSGNVVDHIDSDTLNNRLDNLREITRQENHKNKNSIKKCCDGRDNAWKKNNGKNGIGIIKVNENGEIVGKYKSISAISNEIDFSTSYIRSKISENGIWKDRNGYSYIREDKYELLFAELPLS